MKDISNIVINKAKEGDKGSFLIIYTFYYEKILQFSTRFLRDSVLAEDLTQGLHRFHSVVVGNCCY